MQIALKMFVLLPALVLLIGLIKPKWILFWMQKPDRISVSIVALLWFMGAATLYAKLYMEPKKQTDHAEMPKNREQANEMDLSNMR